MLGCLRIDTFAHITKKYFLNESQISAASVATLLQSDMRIAMATAFGDAHLDGPLSLGEWLKGRAFVSDTFGTDSAPSESKEIGSTVLAGIGEPITPPQCTTGPTGMKASTHDIESQPCDTHRSNSSWAMEGSSLSDDGCTRRCGQDAGSAETDALSNSSRGGPTVMALPMPSVLVGYTIFSLVFPSFLSLAHVKDLYLQALCSLLKDMASQFL